MKIIDITLPKFEKNKGPDQKITVMFWFKEEGQEVKEGEELVEIQTDKAVLDIECPATGKLKKIIVNAGEEIQDGQKIGEIETAGENIKND